MHSSRQNNHRRPARISEPGAPDSARSWAANLGMRCESSEPGPSIRIKNHRSTIHIGSPDPSIQARVAGCPVLAHSLRKGGFAAKSRKSRIINKSKSFGRVRSSLSPTPPSIRNQKSSINNSRVPCPAPRRSRCPHLLSGAKLRKHCKQAGRLPYSSARTKTTHVGAGALTCSVERSSANASNLTQWHSASPGPRLCSESPPNHGASSDHSGPTTDHSNVCSASGLDFALVVCQHARHT